MLLASPITTKVSGNGMSGDMKISCGCSSMQGWRTAMEDAHSCHPDLASNVSYFGVFDGHGGAEVAQICCRFLHCDLMVSEAFARGDYRQALIDAYLEMDKCVSRQSENPRSPLKHGDVGCTAITALIAGTTLYVANAGDSRCVLSRGDEVFKMSTDHKPTNEAEQARILRAGGYVRANRTNGILALSRAIGDMQYKKDPSLPPDDQIITCVPDVLVAEFLRAHGAKVLNFTFIFFLHSAGDFIVLACDGVWDVMTNEDVVKFVRAKLAEAVPLSQVCELLLENCLAKDNMSAGTDNMSIVIVVANA